MGDADQHSGFESLSQESYLKNKGRIADKANLNRKLNEITKSTSPMRSSEYLIRPRLQFLKSIPLKRS